MDGRSPDEDRAGAELAQGAEDEEGFEPERRGDWARDEVKRERGVDAHGEDVARDLRVGETLDVREARTWERYADAAGLTRAGRTPATRTRGGCGAGIVTGSARGIAGGHPPRCGSEGLKCSRAANAQTWRVLRLNTAERHPELAPTDDIAVTPRARAGGRVRRAGEFRGRCERESRDPTDLGSIGQAARSSFREPSPGSLKKSTRGISIPDLVWALFLRDARGSSRGWRSRTSFWRCARTFAAGARALRIALNRRDHHARRAGDLDSVARPRVRDASQEEGR